MSGAPTPLEVALDARKRAWWATPLCGKRPYLGGWEETRLDPAADYAAFNGRATGAGVVLGLSGLIDLEGDCTAADRVLAVLAPETACRWKSPTGREHRLYRVPADEQPAAQKFQILPPHPGPGAERRDQTLAELRAGKQQSVLPGSAHPDGGRYEWVEAGEPGEASQAELARVTLLAGVAGAYALHYPAYGARHDGALALAGHLRRAGVLRRQAEVIVYQAARASGDEEADERAADVESTYKRAETDPFTGLPRLRELCGDILADWLGKHLPAGGERWAAGSAAATPAYDGPPPQELLVAAAAEKDASTRSYLLRELARACVGDPIATEQYAAEVDRYGLLTRTAFGKAVAASARALKAERRAALAPTPAARPDDGEEDARAPRPLLDVGQGDLPTVSDEARAILCEANAAAPWLFGSEGRIVRVRAGDDGHPAVQELDEHGLKGEISRAARCFTWRERRGEGPVQVEARLPIDVARDILRRADLPLPVLGRMAESPYLAASGELVDRPGYHAGSRTYLHLPPGFSMAPVPERPTAAELARAVALLREPLEEFPYVAESDRAHALAAMLHQPLRTMIPGPTPMHLIEKPTAGAGATLLVDAVALVATGRPAVTMTEAPDEAESRKRITACLVEQPAAVLIDNMLRRLDSPALAAAITAETWTDRTLGLSRMVRCPVRCLWMATGNNPTLSREIARRCVRIRIDPRCERPHLREGFRHPDLRSWVRAHRGELVWAALTVCRAWVAAGCPRRQRDLLGSFEEWSAVMGGVLEVAGIPGFLGSLTELYDAADAEGSGLRALVILWWDHHEQQEVDGSTLFPLALAVEGIDLGSDGERSQRTRLGRLLGRMRDQFYSLDGVGAVCVEQGTQSRGVQRWRLRLQANRGGREGREGRTPTLPTREENGDSVGVGVNTGVLAHGGGALTSFTSFTSTTSTTDEDPYPPEWEASVPPSREVM